MAKQGEQKPEIVVTMTGDLILNARAFAMLGEPRDVTLLYNKDRHLVGIRAGGRFSVDRQPNGNLWKIGEKAFWRRIGLIITETASYEPMCWPACTRDGTLIGGSALFIDISDLVEESEAFRELFLETPEQYREKGSSEKGTTKARSSERP